VPVSNKPPPPLSNASPRPRGAVNVTTGAETTRDVESVGTVTPTRDQDAPKAFVDAAELQELQALGAKSSAGFVETLTRMFSFFGSSERAPVVEPRVVEPPVVKPSIVTAARPRIEALYADPAFKALYDFATEASNAIAREHREWDKLDQIKHFAAAVDFVMRGAALPGRPALTDAPLGSRFSGVQEQRAICHLLLLLMPHEDRTERPMMPDGSRGPAQDLFRPLPDAVLARADDGFTLHASDLPKPNPIFTQHLRAPDLLDAVFKPGQRGLFLASKKFCPGAFLQDRADKNPPTLDKKSQSGHEGDPIMVHIDDVLVKDGVKLARVHVPAQHKVWLNDAGACVQGDEVLPRIDVVLDKTGKPALGPEGQPQPILIPVEHLESYLLAQGQGARSLDFAREEDRALALCYAQVLKESSLTDSNGYTKSLFEWLEQADHRTPPHDVDRIKEAVRQAAFQSVVRYSTHPRRTHFKLDVNPAELAAVRKGDKPATDADWQVQAFLALEQTGIMRDQGNYYEKDKASTTHVHELAWTAQFLKNGFVGGSLDCLGASDAFDKLSKTFLEPLGVISTTAIAEGHGAVLSRVLAQPDENGVIQAGTPMKVKPNELIVGLAMPLSSGRGPAAQYMENWGGYLRINGIVGTRVDFVASIQHHDALLSQVS
jgi:hypothetical protein